MHELLKYKLIHSRGSGVLGVSI